MSTITVRLTFHWIKHIIAAEETLEIDFIEDIYGISSSVISILIPCAVVQLHLSHTI
jgi:hypothetical protein